MQAVPVSVLQAAASVPAAPVRPVPEQAARSVQALFPRLVQVQAPPEFLLPQAP